MIKETKEMIVFGGKLETAVEALSDGVGIGDLSELMSAAKAAAPAIKDANLIVAELVGSTSEEKAELKTDIEVNFKSPAIKGILKALVDVSEIINLFVKK